MIAMKQTSFGWKDFPQTSMLNPMGEIAIAQRDKNMPQGTPGLRLAWIGSNLNLKHIVIEVCQAWTFTVQICTFMNHDSYGVAQTQVSWFVLDPDIGQEGKSQKKNGFLEGH